jgi:hypothetical protein
MFGETEFLNCYSVTAGQHRREDSLVGAATAARGSTSRDAISGFHSNIAESNELASNPDSQSHRRA